MSGSGVIRLLVVDDHPVVRDGIRGLFEQEDGFEVAGEARDGAEALARVEHGGVDVVLMDLRMPGVGGVEAIGRLRDEHPDVRVLVLTTYDSDRDVLPAIEAGATGYLLKDAPRAELVDGVRAAFAGRPVLASTVAGRLMGLVGGKADDPAPRLSERELEVLHAVAEGRTNGEIAQALFISEATVKTHLVHLYDKLGARDRASAVAIGYRAGLLT